MATTDVTYATNIDLAGNELRNARAHILSAAPSAAAGKFYYNSADNKLYWHNGTTWVSAGGADLADLSSQASAYGQTVRNGTASTAARSDHYHALPAHDAAAHSAIKLSDLAAPTSALSILDLNVEDEIVIRGVGNPANGGGGSIRTGGSRYTMVFKPRTATAAYADSDEFYYDSTDATWYTKGKFKVNGDFTVNGNIISPKATGTRTLTGTGAYVSDTIKAVDDTVRLYTRIADKVTEGTWPISIIAMIDAVEKGKITYNQVTHKWEFWGTAGTSGTPIGVGFGSSDPVNGGDLVTLNYLNTAIDAARAGLDVKQSVRVSTAPTTVVGTYNATGGSSGRGQITAAPNTVDGVTLVAGDRILHQAGHVSGSSAAHGIYVVTTVGTGANGVWDRATDFDADAEVTAGAFVFVTEGTTYADSGWVLATNDPITIGGASGTSIQFNQFSGAGQITAGAGMTKTGNTLDVGAGTGISVAADSVGIDTSVVARKYSVTLGTAATSHVITHNLNTQDVQVTVRKLSDQSLCVTAWEATSVNTVTVYFATATGNTHRVTVMG